MSHQYNTRNRRKRKQPHPSYYVGYCEDGESVDAIMRKFAALEQIQEIKKQKAKENKDPNNKKSKSKSPKKSKNKNKEKNEKTSSKAEITDSENDDDDEEEEEEDVDIEVNGNKNNKNNKNNDNDSKEDENGLNDDELAQLFVQTSMFSVNSLKNNNEIMRDKPIVDEEGFVTGYDDRVFNSELILAADYKNVNEDLLDKGQFGDDEYNPALDDDTDGDGGDNSDFFEDVLGGEMPTKNGRIRSKKGGGKGAKRSGKGGKSGRKGGSGSGSGGNRAGVRNAPKSKDGLGMEDIDKHYAYTYGRRLAPLVEGDAARRARALRLRTCSALYTLKVPKYPMPRSWGHRVKRFNGHRDLYGRDMVRAKKELIGFDYIEHNDLTKLKTSDLPHQEFQAVLIDIPWDVSESLFNPREGMIKYEQLKDYPIADIVENGMLFVWIPSELLSPVVKMIEKVWGFRYVEHATFAKKGINNHFKVKKGELMNYTKENLLIFRKGTAKKFVDRIELRHQRTSDTHINFIRFHEKFKRFEIKPREFAYRMIETMLPDATQEIRDAVNNKTDLSKVASRLLYLWAPQYEHRGGWTMMVDKKHLEYLQNIEDDPKWQDPYFPFKRFY